MKFIIKIKTDIDFFRTGWPLPGKTWKTLENPGIGLHPLENPGILQNALKSWKIGPFS